MKAMVLDAIGAIANNPTPLTLKHLPDPQPGPGEVLVAVSACGVCHTDLDEIEGRTPPDLPIVLGHQVVGRIVALGSGVDQRSVGERVGIAWIYSACGQCFYCTHGQENLCPDFQATGRDANGGYAELMVAPSAFTIPIPEAISDAAASPLLCAGAVGVRALRLTELSDGETLGLSGFGASGHLVIQMVRHGFPNSRVYVFARNPVERAFALELGAAWAGDTTETAPEPLHAIIDTTPVWKPVVEAMANLAPGGRLVVNAIRKEDADKEYLLRLDYATHLWMEKEIKSVANVTRQDVLRLSGSGSRSRYSAQRTNVFPA